MNKPKEFNYSSHVGYTRALEKYCLKVESEEAGAHKAEIEQLRAKNATLLAANKDCTLHYEDAVAELEKLQQQKPEYLLTSDGYVVGARLDAGHAPGTLTKLYFAAGAISKTETTAVLKQALDAMSPLQDLIILRQACDAIKRVLAAQPVPDVSMNSGWISAADEEMINTHIGVANLSDSFESAKAKLKMLIDWHVAVATDPAINGGYRLVPIVPTPEMILAGRNAPCNTPGDIIQDYIDLYQAMLEAI